MSGAAAARQPVLLDVRCEAVDRDVGERRVRAVVDDHDLEARAVERLLCE
jgi:hypothetical protein